MPRLIYGRGKVTIETPYNAAFVDALKSRITPQSRSWDQIDKHWVVWEPYVLHACELVKVYYANVIEENPELLNQSKNYGGSGYGQSNRNSGYYDGTRYYNFGSGQWEQRASSGSSSAGASSARPSTDHAVLFVTSDAPKQVIEAAYKALARLYHPDVPGGDNAKMERLNVAYERIKK
jgi:hypothetical protein